MLGFDVVEQLVVEGEDVAADLCRVQAAVAAEARWVPMVAGDRFRARRVRSHRLPDC